MVEPATSDSDTLRTTGMPRWVKVSLIVVVLFAVLIGAKVIFGGGVGDHGPGRHTRPGGGHIP